MTHLTIRTIPCLLAAVLLTAPTVAHAQAPPDASAQGGTNAAGLPSRVEWTFNLDAGWGTFGFGNSLYDNPKEGVPENLSDQWFEGYAKPAISGSYRLPRRARSTAR